MYYFLEPCEKCTCSPGQEAESSAESFSAIPASVLSRLNLTAAPSCSKDSATASCPSSQYGTTCGLSTASLGMDSLTACAVGSHAKTSASLAKGKESQEQKADYGASSLGWFAKYNRASCSWKTRQLWLFADLDESLEFWPRWGTMRGGACLEQETPEGCTNEIESGLLHLPTCAANEGRGSAKTRHFGSPHFRGAKMSERLRTCQEDPMYLTPSFAEQVMDFPVGWTDLKPLAMDKFLRWLHSHGKL